MRRGSARCVFKTAMLDRRECVKQGSTRCVYEAVMLVLEQIEDILRKKQVLILMGL